MTLRLSRTLVLPDEAVTDSYAILGRRGSGKTYAAKKLAEEMLKQHHQIVAIDPTGVWWGLRSSADGTKAGYDVVILGGNEGDVPLEPTAGELVADLVVDTRISVVLDLSLMRKGARTRFLAEFAERLYHRKGVKEHRTPIHLFVDEAHAFVPQTQRTGGSNDEKGYRDRMLGAGEDLVQMGRSRGIGVTLISQRPAVINKNVLSQVAGLICLQLTGSHDRKALDEWIHDVGDIAKRRQFLDTLPELQVGHAIVWVPHLALFAEAHISASRTFDSSATPKVGEQLAPPAARADVDLSALQDAMAETIERAEAMDPKALQAKVRDLLALKDELERELAEGVASRTAVEPAPEPKLVEVEVLTPPPYAPSLREAVEYWKAVGVDVREFAATLNEQAADMIARAIEVDEWMEKVEAEWTDFLADRIPQPASPAIRRPLTTAEQTPLPPAPTPAPRRRTTTSVITDAEGGEVKLARAEKAVLSVLAQYPGGRTHSQLAMLAGYSPKASTIGVALSKLRRAGYVTEHGIPMATQAGIDNADFVDLPSGRNLLEYWRGNTLLKKAERLVFDELTKEYPLEVSHAELCARTGYSPDASTIGVAMSKLRKLELAEGWRAHPVFMEACGFGDGFRAV